MSTPDDRTAAPTQEDDGLHEYARLALEVKDAPSLDDLGRTLSEALADNKMDSEQASLLFLQGVQQSRIITQVMRQQLATPAFQRHHAHIEFRVLDRLREKIGSTNHRGEPFLDWDRFRGPSSPASWTRRNSTMLLGDATRALVRSGAITEVCIEDGPHVMLAMQSSPAAQNVSEAERQMSVVSAYEEATTDANGKQRRLTQSARIHLDASHLLEINQWPQPVRPLTWLEREQVRQAIEDDPQVVKRSLHGGDPSVPVALEAMWDSCDEHTRDGMARRPEQAMLVAKAAVTPFPRPRRESTINEFRRSVSALSSDVQWRRTGARAVADAWLAVFMDLSTFQSRGSKDLRAQREDAARKGRIVWDRMMQSHRAPECLRGVALTTSDLCDVLTRLWYAAVNDPCQVVMDAALEGR